MKTKPLVIVQWPEVAGRRWASLTRTHGLPVEYDSDGERIYVRLVTWPAGIDHWCRSASEAEIEAALREAVRTALGVETV